MTAAPTTTKPSTPRLSEAAAQLVYPDGIVRSSWPRIESRLADMAIRYDAWQSGAVRLILGRGADDRYTATVGGVTMSLPRQVGKTFTIGSLLIALCIEYPGLRVVWTSHHLRTTTNTFRAMQGMVKRKGVRPHLAATRNNGIRTANGEQEICFANGSIIMFGAREHGFGVGIDAIDIMVCDEAQRLKSRALADMVPTTNQARHIHGALLIFIGTPPRPDDDGDEFEARRTKALAGKMLNGIYVEMSADPDADIDDHKQWAKANPSFPHRTPLESMLRMRENLTDDDDWRREAMGIWGTTAQATTIPGWPDCFLDAEPPPPSAIGLAVSLDGEHASIASADVWPDGRVNLSAVDRRADSTWLVAEAKRIQSENGCVVALDEKCPDGTLLPALIDAGVTVAVMKLADYVEACSDLVNRAKERTVTHQRTTELDNAVATAKWRTAGGDGRKVFGRKASSGDIDMLEAATAAMWATSQTTEPWEAWT